MKSWLIIGAGVSGIGAAKLLRLRGDLVRVSEKANLDPEKKALWLSLGVEVCDGGHNLNHLDNIDEIIPSPGVSGSHILCKRAAELGIPMSSEIDLALKDYKGTLIAITGTNGKSTTCAMVYHILKKLGLDAEIGGNFGEPPSSILARRDLPPFLILELSSYQLEQSHLIHPKISVFTSFSYDHIARHGTMQKYLEAKWRLFKMQTPDDLAILPEEVFEAGKEIKPPINARHIILNPSLIEKIIPQEHGPHEIHNRLNATFAVLCGEAVSGYKTEQILSLLDDFKGLPHRCELVGYLGGFPVINDSKSTNVESTIVALVSQKVPVLLMMGGQGKGESYNSIMEKQSLIKALVTFGHSGPTIAKQIKGNFPVYQFSSLQEALESISGIMELGTCPILFSPGCASFDEFKNYEHRGEVFRKAMLPLCSEYLIPEQSL